MSPSTSTRPTPSARPLALPHPRAAVAEVHKLRRREVRREREGGRIREEEEGRVGEVLTCNDMTMSVVSKYRNSRLTIFNYSITNCPGSDFL